MNPNFNSFKTKWIYLWNLAYTVTNRSLSPSKKRWYSQFQIIETCEPRLKSFTKHRELNFESLDKYNEFNFESFQNWGQVGLVRFSRKFYISSTFCGQSSCFTFWDKFNFPVWQNWCSNFDGKNINSFCSYKFCSYSFV